VLARLKFLGRPARTFFCISFGNPVTVWNGEPLPHTSVILQYLLDEDVNLGLLRAKLTWSFLTWNTKFVVLARLKILGRPARTFFCVSFGNPVAVWNGPHASIVLQCLLDEDANLGLLRAKLTCTHRSFLRREPLSSSHFLARASFTRRANFCLQRSERKICSCTRCDDDRHKSLAVALSLLEHCCAVEMMMSAVDNDIVVIVDHLTEGLKRSAEQTNFKTGRYLHCRNTNDSAQSLLLLRSICFSQKCVGVV